MSRLLFALFLSGLSFAQIPSGGPPANADLPPATPAQIAGLTSKLDEMKRLIQAGDLRKAFRVDREFSVALGKLTVRVLTPEERLLQLEDMMAKQPDLRSTYLPMAARCALEAGQLEKAETFAKELLRSAEAAPSAARSSVSVHAAHILLGSVALQRTHDVATAKTELLAASRITSFVEIAKFGPNMSLARDLLASGEQATVLEYLRSFHNLSPEATAKLAGWIKLIQAGAIPDFGANLIFYM